MTTEERLRAIVAECLKREGCSYRYDNGVNIINLPTVKPRYDITVYCHITMTWPDFDMEGGLRIAETLLRATDPDAVRVSFGIDAEGPCCENVNGDYVDMVDPPEGMEYVLVLREAEK